MPKVAQGYRPSKPPNMRRIRYVHLLKHTKTQQNFCVGVEKSAALIRRQTKPEG